MSLLVHLSSVGTRSHMRPLPVPLVSALATTKHLLRTLLVARLFLCIPFEGTLLGEWVASFFLSSRFG